MIKTVTKTYLEDGQYFFEKNRHMCTGFDPRKIYLLGEKYSGLKARGALQNYDEIRDSFVKQKALFSDPQFPPEKIELGEEWEKARSKIKWLRPKDIVSNPIFLEDGEDKFDVNQGGLGDCWFLAALAEITGNHKLLQLIVPEGQSFSNDYAGVFHFRFWQYGRWIDIIVDDRLPTVEGNLIFNRSKYKNVFWTPLLEKAYAKLYASYKNIEGGFISEALEDFTGGLNELYFELIDASKNLNFYEMLLVSYIRKSFMGCGITDSGGVEEQRKDGLYSRHAYSITDVAEVSCKLGNVYRLLRLRNPWGTKEWNGDWCDNSKTWDLLPEETKQKLLLKKDDGEFWMQFEHFIEAYNLLEFCHPNPDSLAYAQDEVNQWKSFMVDAAWVAKVSNGGLPTSRDFCLNSQFLLSINEKSDKKHKVLVGVMQKNRRVHNLPELPIGFAIYTLKAPANGPLTQNFFSSIKPTYVRNLEVNKQVTGHVDLPNGTYCIVPFTENAKSSCEYLLRVYSSVDFNVDENDVEVKLLDTSRSAGFGVGPDTVDSASADKAIKEVFEGIAEDSEMGWKGLKSVLDLLLKQENNEFNKELCRSMVALADTDHSGKLNFNEFYQLWEQIGNLRGIFRKYDSNTSNGIASNELRSALKGANLQVSNKILRMIILRYANENGELEMEEFLHCCIKLKMMIDIYNSQKQREGSLEKWLMETIYT